MGKKLNYQSMKESLESKKKLIIATSNKGKFKEFKEFLCQYPFLVCSQPQDIEVKENGNSYAENARLKALKVANSTGNWALADDSGLSVDALEGAPGIYSSRYAKTDQERINRLLCEMSGCQNRKASFYSSLCFAAPEKILFEVQGFCNGFVTDSPRGNNGFGYDPIFEEEKTGLTFAEMGPDLKMKYGHRGIAFSLLEVQIKRTFNI